MANIVSRPKETQSICTIFSGPISLSTGIDYALVASEQARDPDIVNLLYTNQTLLQLKNIPQAEHGTALLCDISQNRVHVVVPNELCFTIFKIYHSLSHPGIDATVKLIQRAFVWYNMKRDIANWVRECQACAKSKIQRHNQAPTQQVLPPPSERLTHIYVDIMGPLSNSGSFNYLLVVIDCFTRYFQAIPLVGISTQECIDAFIQHWVAWAGCPQHIYTDSGAQFLSVTWREMSQYLGAKLHFATSYHP